MGYQVSNVEGTPEEKREIAAFLAAFVKDGELARPRPGDDDPLVWERRMGWWWDENPFCKADSPRGHVLRHEGAEIVGFSGFIPFDYEADGKTLPTLAATTFFVREGHRSAVMGLLARLRQLARDYQIVDGSPSPEMRRLLEKFGYRKAGDRFQFFFPTSRLGGSAARVLLRQLGWSFDLLGIGAADGHHIVTDPGEWHHTVPGRDGQIHRVLSRESLSWLCRVGSESRSFFGLVDADGEPVAHAIGVYKRLGGILVCRLLDYREYRPGGQGIPRLIGHLLADSAAGLDPSTAVLVYSCFGTPPCTDLPGRRAPSILHYQIPAGWEQHSKACLPCEGDLALV